MRIAFIGNSHIAALKQGWDLIADQHPDVEIRFFAAAKADLSKWSRVGDGIWPTNARAREGFALSAPGLDRLDGSYDAYYVVGLQLGLYRLLRLLRTHRTPATYEPRRYQLISSAVLEATAFAHAGRALACAEAVSAVAAPGTVRIIPSPLLSESWAPNRTRAANTRAYIRELADVYRATLAKLPFPVREQPEATVVEGLYTKSEYGLGSIGLDDDTHKPTDFVHMNAAYGRAVIEEILS